MAGVAVNAAGGYGIVALGSGAIVGLATFDTILALGLGIFLPAGMPGWTVPVAVTAATATAVAGIALGATFGWVYTAAVYAGSDCVCGADLLLIPLVTLTATAGGAVAATVLTTTAAAMEE